MQTDSTPDRRGLTPAPPAGGLRSAAIALGSLLLLSGCVSRPAIVVEDLLLPIAPATPWLPAESDLAAARLARAALIAAPSYETTEGDTPIVAAAVESALQNLMQSVEAPQAARLIPIAIDLRNATLDDPIAHRDASRKLRKRRGLDPRLESRLDQTIADDPLRLANRRQFDGWHRLWARSFNAVSEPLGNSLITGFVLAPFQLANSIIHYFADFSNTEPLSPTGRQALVLRQNFLAKHPDTEWTEKLEKKVARNSLRLEKTLAQRRARLAGHLLDSDRPDLAAYQAGVALDILDLHPKAHRRLRRRAQSTERKARAQLDEIDRNETAALQASPAPTGHRDLEFRLSAALLSGSIAFDALEAPIAAYLEAGGGADKIEFVRAIAQRENGFEAEARTRLARLAARRDDLSCMARHARALLEDEWQNPYPAFERLRRQATRDELAWRLAGEWVNRPRYPNLPGPVGYLVDAPTIAMTIILAPLRAFISPWNGGPDFKRAAVLAGYRYLQRFPDGIEQSEVLDWLYEYETDRERFGRALRLADLIPDFDPEERDELVEKTAEARRASVDRLDRRDQRSSLLKGVAREFPDSEPGHAAGLQAREEAEDSSAQHIRITRSFLLENPTVAGPNGLGLNPRLLNDDPADGELHPEGVVLRGGRTLEIRLIAEGADDDDPPESRLRRVGKQRLMQVAARLNEAVHRNSLIDHDARQELDARRDVYLERAGHGLTEDADLRPAAESSFVYQSLRERYGLVRGRDSILPFDLVFRASLADFGLGAFPRWRSPPQTPDVFLYR